MTIPSRLAIAAYLVVLSLFLVIGQWRFQGPVLLGLSDAHGLHAGDLVIIALTGAALVAVLRAR